MPNRELFYPHTLKFDVSSIKRKRHIADLPYINVDISAAFRYNVKTECALVFPIYGTAPNFGHHLYAKSAIYAALTFLLNTDLKAYGVQVYFAIGDMYADEILPYFQKASIPTQCIAVFDQHYLAHQLATTAAVFCDELKAVSKFLLIDADMYVHRPAGSPVLDLFGPLLASWTRPFCWGYWGDAGKSDWHPFSVEYYHYQSQNEMEIYWEKLSDLVNTPVQVVKRLFHIDDRTIPRGLGWFAGFDVARAIKDSAFYDFFLQAQDILLQDESFMSAWMYRNGSNSELWDTPPFWAEDPYFWESVSGEKNARIYHLGTDEHLVDPHDVSKHYDTWKDRWLSDMKQVVSHV